MSTMLVSKRIVVIADQVWWDMEELVDIPHNKSFARVDEIQGQRGNNMDAKTS